MRHDFTHGSLLNRPLAPLTDAQLMRVAPSIFAQEAHDSRSDKYTYLPTIRIVERLRDVGFVPVEASQSRCILDDKRAYTKHRVRFMLAPSTDLQVRVGDVFPQVSLVNAHDGTSSYQMDAGLHRYVCGNGLLVCDSSFGGLRIPHRGNIVQDVIEGSFEVIERANRAVAAIEDWSAVQLAPPEQEAFARAALTLRFDGAAPVPPQQILRARRAADEGADLWTTFNRVQEHLTKGGNRYHNANGRRMSTRPVTGIDSDNKLNRALWQLAEELRTLKAA